VTVLQDDFFVKRVTDTLRNAAFDLSAGENGIEDAAYFLYGPEVLDFSGVGDGVDGDLRNLDGPGEGGIGFAAIFLIVPEDVGRSLLVAKRNDFAMRGAITLAGREEFFARESFAEGCVLAKHV